MKRIKVTLLAPQEVGKKELQDKLGTIEIERFEQRDIPPEPSLEDEFAFHVLLEAGWDFANGIWLVVKGLFNMSKWAIVLIVQGFMWLWKEGVGKKDEDQKKKNGVKK